MIKKLLSLALVGIIVTGMSTTTFAAENENLAEMEMQNAIHNFSANVDIEDGATYVLYKNSENKTIVSEYTPTLAKGLSYTPGDGVLEYAVFHVGFKNWVDTTGDLYYTITADEQLKTVAGSAYVSATNLIFPESFYDDSWYHTLSPSSTTATRALKDDIDVGNSEDVKVGFKNVTITLVNGRGGSFANNSKVVTK